jgi:hypothetical protein
MTKEWLMGEIERLVQQMQEQEAVIAALQEAMGHVDPTNAQVLERLMACAHVKLADLVAQQQHWHASQQR